MLKHTITLKIINKVSKKATAIELTSTNLEDAKKEIFKLLTEYSNKDNNYKNNVNNVNNDLLKNPMQGKNILFRDYESLGDTPMYDFYLRMIKK